MEVPWLFPPTLTPSFYYLISSSSSSSFPLLFQTFSQPAPHSLYRSQQLPILRARPHRVVCVCVGGGEVKACPTGEEHTEHKHVHMQKKKRILTTLLSISCINFLLWIERVQRVSLKRKRTFFFSFTSTQMLPWIL